MNDHRGNFGMASRILDVLISEKGLFYVLEYLRRRFPRQTIDSEMQKVERDSLQVHKADKSRDDKEALK